MKRSIHECGPPRCPMVVKRPRQAASNDENAPVNHPFSFPFPPYNTQLKLMNDIYEIIKTKSVGILESPTGTGKTLTSLCAVLSFIEDEQRAVKLEIAENRRIIDELKKGNEDDDFDTSLKKFKEADELSKIADEKEDKFVQVKDRIEAAERRISTLDPGDIEDVPGGPRDAPKPKLLKLVYATRTHSQIEQLTNELKRTRFMPRTIALGSRGMLCPNPVVNKLPASAAVDRCKELRECSKCPYYTSKSVLALTDRILVGECRDLSSVVSSSISHRACGYYASREAASFCEVVFVPYATLLDSQLRSAVGLTIDDETIVIVDEAHNLFANLTEMSSASLDTNQLALAIDVIGRFLEVRGDHTAAADFKNLKLTEAGLKQCLKVLRSEFYVRRAEKNMSAAVFLEETLKNDAFRLIQAMERAKKSNLFSRIFSFYRSSKYQKADDVTEVTSTPADLHQEPRSGVAAFLHAKSHASKPAAAGDQISPAAAAVTSKTEVVQIEKTENVPTFPLFNVVDFFSALAIAGDNFQIIVNPSANPRRVQLLCLNGGEKFLPVVTQARSTILLGGTMRPSELITSLLTKDCGIAKDKIINQSYDHIIGIDNLKIALIDRDKEGYLTFTHKSMQTPTMMLRLLGAIARFSGVVENGLVVFFPSKSFLNSVLAAIKREGKNSDVGILKSRPLFIEGENATVFDRYSEKAKKQRATLFAVLGGKFSEGVNFNDELARCVVIIGLPYPNVQTSEFLAKTTYLKSHFNNDTTIGSDFAVNICMTAVNQAIGRVVRHRSDYGIVALIDARFTEQRHAGRISRWAQSCIVRGLTSVDAVVGQKFRGFG